MESFILAEKFESGNLHQKNLLFNKLKDMNFLISLNTLNGLYQNQIDNPTHNMEEAIMPNINQLTYVNRELEFVDVIQQGDRGKRARRVQEWASFHGFGTAVDSDFGPATKAVVRRFQEANGLPADGVVDASTWNRLVEPMSQVLKPIEVDAGDNLGSVLLALARQHLAQHPHELGGQNRGPWVRLYMEGKEGRDRPWCAGFVSFVLRHACETLDCLMPIEGSISCDSLAHQAKQAGLFVPGSRLRNGSANWNDLGEIQIFLVRRTSTDWTHTGFAFEGNDEIFSTIEGNTNDEGTREGYEVCQRSRGIKSKDFIRVPD